MHTIQFDQRITNKLTIITNSIASRVNKPSFLMQFHNFLSEAKCLFILLLIEISKRIDSLFLKSSFSTIFAEPICLFIQFIIKNNDPIHRMPRRKTIGSNYHQTRNTEPFSPLVQITLNTNCSTLVPPPPKTSIQQNYISKRAFYQKLQKAQLDHCRIDIVNRKNSTTLTQTSKSNQNKTSNIAMLKKEIEYLEEDSTRWDKFPKDNLTLNFVQSTHETNNKPEPSLNLHSLQQMASHDHKSLLLESFLQTFNQNFFIAPFPSRPLTSDERRAKKYLSLNKKKSYRKCTALQLTNPSLTHKNNKENTQKGIHSNIQLCTPFRKYFMTNRSRKQSSCTTMAQQITGNRLRGFAFQPTKLQTL